MSSTPVKSGPGLLVGGSWGSGSSGTYEVINPATGCVIGIAAEASAADAAAAASAARAALPAWSHMAARERAELLRAVSRRLKDLSADLVPLIISETGATVSVGSLMQVPIAINRFEYYADAAMFPLATGLPPSPMPGTPQAPGALMGAVVNPQPIGVVACIVPYNFPLSMMAGKVAAALAAGNTIVMKAPPQDPLTIVRLAQIMNDIGFPPGVVNLITGTQVETAAALVASDDVDMISFTGSVAVGRAIGQAAGYGIKRTLLELGGKGAAIVLHDADVDRAAATISSCWGFHSGQICQAPSRVIVHNSLAKKLTARLINIGGRMRVGDPLDTKTVVGPVISASHRDNVERYVQSAQDEGAEVVLGGLRPDMERGYYVAPTLLTGCTPEMRAVREEIFGPVVTVMTFDTEEEAVMLANDSDYGLYDYVFSRDSARAYRLAGALRSGGVGINTNQRHMDAPFGGTKLSGLGREGGMYSIREYIEWQTVAWPA